MTDDPQFNPGPESGPESGPDSGPEITPESAAESRASGDAASYSWPSGQDALVAMQTPEPLPPLLPRLVPNIGHAAVFALLLIPAFVGGYLLTLIVLLAIVHPHSIPAFMGQIAKEVRYAILMQAVAYILWIALSGLLFSLWWQRPFFAGIHWNAAAARRWLLRLGLLGIITGLVITLAGSFVPMPKAPPILEDLTKSRVGAWLLMIFGVTLAPITEEIAFRGFLLPSLINIFRWMERQRMIGEAAVRRIGIPLAIVLTSVPFALLHASQVADAWGPVLLIGLVSVVLCIVRLRTSSVACGIVVHSMYNFTLFASLILQTDGFRHLDKLKG